MKAVGFTRSLPAADPQSLIDFQTDVLAPTGTDLLVEVRAVSVNPVDYRVRRDMGPGNFGTRVLGYDAAGVVSAVGSGCTLFKPGDAVWYAGELMRRGSNSQFHLVDERLVGPKPASLSWADAAALPLTFITAWEGLFEQLRVRRDGSDSGKTLLILGGAGGVGSILIQLARNVGLQVIATASRPQSVAQCERYGAHRVIDHGGDIKAQLAAAGHKSVDLIFSCAELDGYFQLATELLAPFGSLCTIVAPNKPVDLGLFKVKALRYAHEFMFTRGMFRTADMIEQHRLLKAGAAMFDAGTLQGTRSATLGTINAANLRAAHVQLETTHTLGKLVLEGWD